MKTLKEEYGIIGYIWHLRKVPICLACVDYRKKHKMLEKEHLNDPIDELEAGLWDCDDCGKRIV